MWVWEGGPNGDPGVRRPDFGSPEPLLTHEGWIKMAAPLTPSTADAPISVPVWAWILAAAAVFVVYLMTMENGALLGHAAENAHEFFHDARHFVGVPCH
jgi:hypothetical protein